MINLAICDTEKIHRLLLSEAIRKYFEQYDVTVEIYEYERPKELLESKFHFHLIFLDAVFENTSGIDIGLQLRQYHQNCPIIITAKNADYAMDGYKIDAFRYILKPIEQNDINEIFESYYHRTLSDFLKIKWMDENYFIRFQEITYLQSIGRKRFIHTIYGVAEVNESLTALLSRLPARDFFQISRSNIVNLNYIFKIGKKSLQLKNMVELPISRRKYDLLLDCMNKRIAIQNHFLTIHP